MGRWNNARRHSHVLAEDFGVAALTRVENLADNGAHRGCAMNVDDRQIERLIRAEGLDDLEALLVPREWDEVPFVSRLPRLAFLDGVDVQEKSRILVVAAVKHLDRIRSFVEEKGRREVVVMVSVTDWDYLTASEPKPEARPRFVSIATRI